MKEREESKMKKPRLRACGSLKRERERLLTQYECKDSKALGERQRVSFLVILIFR